MSMTCISDRCIEQEKQNARNRDIWFSAVDLNEAKMLAGLRIRKKIEDEIHLCIGTDCVNFRNFKNKNLYPYFSLFEM